MPDPRMSRNLDIALGSGSKGPLADMPAEVPPAPEGDAGEGGMTCPVCGSKFTVVPEAAPEAAGGPVAPEGGM